MLVLIDRISRRDIAKAVVAIALAPGAFRALVAMCSRCFLLGIAAVAGAAFSQVQPGTANKCERMLDAASVRKRATKTVRPVYPEQAVRGKVIGVVVAEVCVPAGGTIAAFWISSAPSDAIAESVKQALSQWRFKPWSDDAGYHAYGGKIVFYFVEQNTEWKVLEPADAFYVGPRFALKQQRPLSR